MEAWYHAQALWRLVSGASKAPTISTPPREGEEDKLEAWQVKADKAAGIMFLMFEPMQSVHFRGIKDDAVKMWGALEAVHMQKRPGTRFNAYDDLFSIWKRDDEDLQSLINRVDDSVHRIRNLRSTGFTQDQLDNELASMMLIQALPDDYNAFVSSLLLKDDLDKIAVQNAFVCEDNQRKHCQDDSPTVGNALAASSSSSLVSISPNISTSKFELTQNKWTSFVMVGHFSVLQSSPPTAHISLVRPPSESANWVSTLPLTLSLWHCRCCHHNLVDITKMHKEGW